jgi:hypothetical protein
MPLAVTAVHAAEVDPTAAQTVVVAVTPLEAPVTVMLYAPAVVPDTVVAVNTEVSAVVLVIETEVGERAHVAAFEAPEGELTAQVNVTVPVNELAGVTVIVDVPVEPAVTVMLPLLVRAKLVDVTGASQKPAQPVTRAAAKHIAPANAAFFIRRSLQNRLLAETQEYRFGARLVGSPYWTRIVAHSLTERQSGIVSG